MGERIHGADGIERPYSPSYLCSSDFQQRISSVWDFPMRRHRSFITDTTRNMDWRFEASFAITRSVCSSHS